MKNIRLNLILFLCLIAGALSMKAQDSTKVAPTVNLRYFSNNNNFQYLIVQARIKVDKKLQPVQNQKVQFYLDINTPENLIGETTTDESGKAKAVFQPELKDKWLATEKHSFVAVLKGATTDDDVEASLDITRAKIEMDTITEDGVRSITVKVSYLEGTDWKPASDVEMRLGVSRSGGILSAGTEESYTTDSTGSVTVEFKRDSLPGDDKGNFILMAKIEDNDTYGNLVLEKVVPWGVPVVYNTTFFDQRTLWTTRFKTPFWLLFMAYTIVIIVWGTVIYLITQIVKIGKLSKQEPN